MRSFLAALLFFPCLTFADTTLPTGPAPAPVPFPHFPDPLHAFVWRNWNLVPISKLATVLQTSDENVKSLAASMGLPPAKPVPPEYRSRLYLSIIRRNWHLLPYDQLLTLLDMTPAQLAHTLREDDFLWIKLGSLKPTCPKLIYSPPTLEASRRAAKVKKWVDDAFDDQWPEEVEPRFAFLKTFTRPVTDAPAPKKDDQLRFLYSYFAVFGDPLLDPSLDPLPDGLLHQLSKLGVNGVWLHVVLRDLAPSKDFPEFGQDHEKRLASLRALVQRAKRFGVGIYLYMNEPRAMSPAFFKDRPDLAGTREADFIAMCTSTEKVRRWLSDSLEHVFKNVPGVAGVFTITASENFTSCASHFNHKSCPRCKDRPGADIIAEVNTTIASAVHRASPSAKVIAWDWGWPDDWAPQIISKLPMNVWLQSVSEWSIPISRGGVKTTVGEYSISVVGPGPRATRHWKLARDAGLKTSAKVQVNNTWELSAIPYIPVMDLIAEHAHNLATLDMNGLQLSWTLGGYPSPNLDLVSRFNARPAPDREQVLQQFAIERFGPDAAPHARKAWAFFSEAFREFPYDGSVVYNAPLQLGPANLLYAAPTGYSATMVGLPYDSIKTWSGPYGPEIFASQFEKLCTRWEEGIVEMSGAVSKTPPHLAAAARSDLRMARAARLHFRSVANQTRFILARDALAKVDLPQRPRHALTDQIRAILVDESDHARELLALTNEDSRIGFEASNHYYYLTQDLVEKMINCRNLLEHFTGVK